MTKEKIDIMDKILDYKTELCDKYNVNLTMRCLLTDLLFAAANAGRIEALENLNAQFHLDYDKKTMQKKMDALQKHFNKKAENANQSFRIL